MKLDLFRLTAILLVMNLISTISPHRNGIIRNERSLPPLNPFSSAAPECSSIIRKFEICSLGWMQNRLTSILPSNMTYFESKFTIDIYMMVSMWIPQAACWCHHFGQLSVYAEWHRAYHTSLISASDSKTGCRTHILTSLNHSNPPPAQTVHPHPISTTNGTNASCR